MKKGSLGVRIKHWDLLLQKSRKLTRARADKGELMIKGKFFWMVASRAFTPVKGVGNVRPQQMINRTARRRSIQYN